MTDWRVVTLAFLPRHADALEQLIDELNGSEEVIAVAPPELYDEFRSALAEFAAEAKVLNAGTAVAVLATVARDRARAIRHDPEAWVRLDSILDTDSVPAAVANVLAEALTKAITRGEVAVSSPWSLLEFLAANYLAEA